MATRQGCVKVISMDLGREDRADAPPFLLDSLNTVVLASLLCVTAWFDCSSCCVLLCFFVSVERSRFPTVCHLYLSSFPSVRLSVLISCPPRPLLVSVYMCTNPFSSVTTLPFSL